MEGESNQGEWKEGKRIFHIYWLIRRFDRSLVVGDGGEGGGSKVASWDAGGVFQVVKGGAFSPKSQGITCSLMEECRRIWVQ